MWIWSPNEDFTNQQKVIEMQYFSTGGNHGNTTVETKYWLIYQGPVRMNDVFKFWTFSLFFTAVVCSVSTVIYRIPQDNLSESVQSLCDCAQKWRCSAAVCILLCTLGWLDLRDHIGPQPGFTNAEQVLCVSMALKVLNPRSHVFALHLEEQTKDHLSITKHSVEILSFSWNVTAWLMFHLLPTVPVPLNSNQTLGIFFVTDEITWGVQQVMSSDQLPGCSNCGHERKLRGAETFVVSNLWPWSFHVWWRNRL